MTGARDPGRSDVGLCATCRHAQRQESARGSTFWRCRRADDDPAFRRYPALPVVRCSGFEAAPGSAPPTAAPRDEP
ncbi:MAG TPA: hypothetical protein VMW35_00900 [Myxococcota bacterium]|nr:hypothetical protein [Myxococcota bacterium]